MSAPPPRSHPEIWLSEHDLPGPIRDAILALVLQEQRTPSDLRTEVSTHALLRELRDKMRSCGLGNGAVKLTVADREAAWVRTDPFRVADPLLLLAWGAVPREAGARVGPLPAMDVIAKAMRPGSTEREAGPDRVAIDIVPRATDEPPASLAPWIGRAEDRLRSEGASVYRVGGRVRVLFSGGAIEPPADDPVDPMTPMDAEGPQP